MGATKIVFPLPEAINPREWIIEQTNQPRVSLTDGRLFVNLSPDPQWRNVRHHELGHIKFTPKTAKAPKDVSDFAMQATEDMRINYLLRHKVGLDLRLGGPDMVINAAVTANIANPRLLTGLIMADVRSSPIEGREDHSQAFGHAKAQDAEQAQRAYVIACKAFDLLKMDARTAGKILGTGVTGSAGKPLTWKRTLAVARWFDEVFKAKEDGKKHEGDPSEPPPSSAFDKPATIDTSHLSAKWGRLKLEYPRLDLPRDSRMRGGKKLQDEGSMMRAPWRITTDGKVFSRPGVRRRGTVLIDGSGSMHLDEAMVQDIVKRLPMGTVAVYHSSDMKTGPLKILARHGKIASDANEYRVGGGNVVDGPALEWLGHQEEPRLWVCDGQVTGIGDGSSATLTAQATRLLMQYRVKQFINADKLFDYLKTQVYKAPLSRDGEGGGIAWHRDKLAAEGGD